MKKNNVSQTIINNYGNRILEYRQEGLTIKEIADKLSLPLGKMQYFFQRNNKLYPTPIISMPNIKIKFHKQILKYRLEGLSHNEIAEKLGLSKSNMQYFFVLYRNDYPKKKLTKKDYNRNRKKI
jgi:orotate phosphoribosyltransferase-like protein